MPRYRSYDDTELAYRVLDSRDGASTPPLLCLAGGPARDAAYLGNLGGLDAHRPLVLPDARGTGDSPTAADPSAYAFPALAEDLESLREHLGLERFALLAHDAGTATAQAYAAAHPDRLSRLVLLCPGARLQGELPDDAREIFDSRRDEPWWPDAAAAIERLARVADFEEVRDLLLRAAPMAYAHWDEPQRTHAATEPGQLNPVPRAGFWQGVGEPARKAILEHLGETGFPVLVVTGALDAVTGLRSGELVAESFPRARSHVLKNSGHYPWLDEPDELRVLVENFLSGSRPGTA
ncbi:alpha/beta fold hydrolase [Streptomyces sp. MNU89]|uniref:alpha/beta fold hydrolase n=1 Tax=Streptomyces sp. MNU89 TaxID=2560025 RepID=UPI001E287BD1|nr:alpha/beta hydrolase [Streptomyces sp. MNU89]MCC9741240.1 alpha/beta hydrolase [Streptomyces sp. MNU89]